MAENCIYTYEVLRPPLNREASEELINLLSYEAEPFHTDIRKCLSDTDRNTTCMFVVCRNDLGKVVSNVWIGWNDKQTGVRVGLLGRVVTKEAYRRRGLAIKVLQLAMSEFYGPKIRGDCLLLVTEEAIPYSMYTKVGFKSIMGCLEINCVVMLHSKYSLEPQEYIASYFKKAAGGDLTSEVTSRRHSAAIAFLLSSFPTKEVRLNDRITICSEFDTEEETLELMTRIEEGVVTSSVLLSDGRVVGIEIADRGERITVMHPNFLN